MSIRALCIGILVCLVVENSRAQTVDEAKPYGRAAVTVVDAAAKTEAPLKAETKPGPGRFVVVHLDANSPCEALVAAFSKGDGKLAFGWRPAVVVLPEWEEKAVGKDQWAWKSAAEPFEVFVLFFAPGSADAAPIRKLIAAIKDAKSEGKLLEMQANKLHELIGQAIADKDLSKFSAKAQPSEVAGVLRGDSFPWRQYARGANFTAQKPGVLIFPSLTEK